MYCFKSVLFSVEIQSSVLKLLLPFYTANYLAKNFSDGIDVSKSKSERLIFELKCCVLMKIYLQLWFWK